MSVMIITIVYDNDGEDGGGGGAMIIISMTIMMMIIVKIVIMKMFICMGNEVMIIRLLYEADDVDKNV